MNGRKLVSLHIENGNPNTIYVSFCDYTGHRAAGTGDHYTASHRASISTETLYRLLDGAGLFEHRPGNEPDRCICGGCQIEMYADELDLVWTDEATYDYLMLCAPCRAMREQEA